MPTRRKSRLRGALSDLSSVEIIMWTLHIIGITMRSRVRQYGRVIALMAAHMLITAVIVEGQVEGRGAWVYLNSAAAWAILLTLYSLWRMTFGRPRPSRQKEQQTQPVRR